MSKITTRIDPKDLQRISSVFRAIQLLTFGRAGSTILHEIGAYQQRQLAIAFDRERDPETGAPWPPLAPSTQKQKRNKKMLVETIGRIPSSLFYKVEGRSIIVGYGDPLAMVHHFGATTKPRIIRPKRARALYWVGANHPVKFVNHPGSVLPARPLVGASKRDREEWVIIGQEKLRKVWG